MVKQANLSSAEAEFRRLREAYDRAFHQFSLALDNGGGVADAEREYHERRDALAAFIMSAEQRHPQKRDVAQLAYRLWEQAGRPPGTAESDWYRAEALLDSR